MKTTEYIKTKNDDPWTFFGSYSRTEADEVSDLLQEAGIIFDIKEEKKKEVYLADGWSGPFSIWIRDEHSVRASDILVPHFQKAK